MAPTAAQFSPGQILDAGRRAESDGRIGYAIQFYRHLTDHHGWSPEAAIAKEALARLQNFRPAEPAPGGALAPDAAAPTAPQQQQSLTQPNWGHGPQGNGGSAMNGSRPQIQTNNGPPYGGQSAAQPAPRALATSGRQGPIPGEASGQPLRLPEPERRYRIGSIVAWLLFSIGLLLITASLILMGLHALGIKVPGTLGTLLGFTGGFPGAFGIFTVGITQVFAAQIGRALFDNANAVRDLAMIERAKIAHAAGENPFGDDENEPA
jgi:hypothetical protein